MSETTQALFDLPSKVTPPTTKDPRKAVFFSHTKVGKTTVLAALPNNLIIDLEDGSSFVSGMKLNIKEIARQKGKSPLHVLKEVANSIREANKECGGYKYDFITLDTATAMEEMATKLAVILYKKTNIGKGFTGTDVVTELPQGAGYGWLRKAFDEIYALFEGLAGKCLIVSAHVKTASISKNGKDLQAKDLNLTGKLKTILCADVDAIGYLYRKDNTVIASFKTDEQDLATGSRSEHLRNEEFVLSEYDPKSREFTYHWDKIFSELKTKKK